MGPVPADPKNERSSESKAQFFAIRARIIHHIIPEQIQANESEPMADLQKLLFESPAKVSDREILVTARLNARVRAFAGHELSDDIVERINESVADEMDKLISEGVLRERPDWLAVIVRRRLHVAFGSSAVQQLSRELKQMGAV